VKDDHRQGDKGKPAASGWLQPRRCILPSRPTRRWSWRSRMGWLAGRLAYHPSESPDDKQSSTRRQHCLRSVATLVWRFAEAQSATPLHYSIW